MLSLPSLAATHKHNFSLPGASICEQQQQQTRFPCKLCARLHPVLKQREFRVLTAFVVLRFHFVRVRLVYIVMAHWSRRDIHNRIYYSICMVCPFGNRYVHIHTVKHCLYICSVAANAPDADAHRSIRWEFVSVRVIPSTSDPPKAQTNVKRARAPSTRGSIGIFHPAGSIGDAFCEQIYT